MNSRGRFSTGVLFAAIGIALWTWLLWSYEPVAHHANDSFSLSGGRDLRLSVLVLGVGGILIATRGARLAAWLTLALGVAWFGADYGLDVRDVTSVGTVVAAGVVVAVVAAAIIVVGTRAGAAGASSAPAWWLLIYAGFAVGVATYGASNGPRPPVENLAILVVVLASAVVAGAAVNPDGTRPPGQWLAVVLVLIAIAFVAPSYFLSPNSIILGPAGVMRELTTEATAVLPLPLVAAAAIAMTGGLSGRRGVVAAPAVVLALVPAAMARTMPGFDWLVSFFGRGTPFDETDTHRYLPGQLVAGLLVGMSMWVLARLAPRLFEALSPAPGRPARTATVIGSVIGAVGLVSWGLATFVVTPDTLAPLRFPMSIHPAAALNGWSTNLRWGAILLAWGGLLLAARPRARGLPLALAVLVWWAADLALVAHRVDGWLPAGIGIVVVGAVLATVVFVGARAPVDRPAGSVALAAAAAGAGIPLMAIEELGDWNLPGWLFPFGLVVSLLLAVTAGVHTLLVAPRVRATQVVAAGVVTVVGVGAVLLHYGAANGAGRFGVSEWVDLSLIGAVTVVALGAALSAANLTPARWWAAVVAAGLGAVGTLPLFIATGMLGFTAQDLEAALLKDVGVTGEWYSDVVAGGWLGVSLAALTLLAVAAFRPAAPAQPATVPADQ